MAQPRLAEPIMRVGLNSVTRTAIVLMAPLACLSNPLLHRPALARHGDYEDVRDYYVHSEKKFTVSIAPVYDDPIRTITCKCSAFLLTRPVVRCLK